MQKFLFIFILIAISTIHDSASAQVAPSDYDKQCTTTYQQKTYWWGTGTCQVFSQDTLQWYTIPGSKALIEKYERPSFIVGRAVTQTKNVSCEIQLPNVSIVQIPTEICTYQPRQPFTSVSIDNPTCLNGNLVGSLNWSMNVGETFEVQTRNRPNSQWASASWITYSGYSVTLFGSPYGTNGERLDFRVRLSSNGKTGSWSESASMSGNCWGVDTP